MRRWAASAAVMLAASLPAPPVGASPQESEVVVVYRPGGLDATTLATVERTARRAGAHWTVVHSGTVQVVRVLREGRVVQEAPPGYRFPVSVSAAEPAAAAALFGGRVGEALTGERAVLGRLAASFRSAREDDLIELVGWDGELHRLEVGAVVADDRVGWREMVLSTEVAASVGMVRPSSAVVWGAADGPGVRRALEEQLPPEGVGIRASWDPPDPDRVLPATLLKRRFGEFAYRPTGGDGVRIHPDWVDANITILDLPHLGPVPCHRSMAVYLEGALQELARNGFVYQLDQEDFRDNGGCYNPRLIRGGDKGGALSRHAWGAALDVNPSRNPYGGPVVMNRRVVEAFRQWGFAWGGTWVSVDGGHFEWSHHPEFLVGKPSARVSLLPPGAP